MDVSFYTASTGVIQQQDRLTVHANNLANINNEHFHALRPSFATLISQAIPGIEENVARGVGSRMQFTQFDPEGERVEQTDRPMDYAVNGNGFFALLDPATGEYTYTRDGAFDLTSMQAWETPGAEETEEPEPGEAENPGDLENPENPEEEAEPELVTHWYLSDKRGRLVIGSDGRPIEVEDEESEIQMGKPLPVGIFDFINYYGMKSLDENRLSPIEGNGDVYLGGGTLMQGYRAMSTVDIAYEFTKVIETQRVFSLMVRMVQTSDEITTAVNNLR